MTHSITSQPLDHRWHKAAYLGSLWASVEIVLGSFLHNAKFPLTGTILSAIGIALLVAGHSLWKEKGIIWRAGIICAVMKSVSPSAVIIGPMIGISLEALIVEAAIRLTSGNAAGYFVGGAVACTTPLIQKVISYLFTYGSNIAVVFDKLVEFAAKSLRIPSLSSEHVMTALLLSNIILGSTAAWIGMLIGKRAAAFGHDLHVTRIDRSERHSSEGSVHQKFSLILLSANLLFIVAGLITQSVYFLVFIPLWYSRYQQVQKRFRKISFWMEIGGVSLFAGIFLGAIVLFDIKAGSLLGLQMFLRAMFIVTAFSAVSAELRNPVIGAFMMKNRLRKFSLALDSAFSSLPMMIDRIQTERTFFKHPVDSLANVLAYTDSLLQQKERGRSIFILTGEKGSGKSSFLLTLKESLIKENINVGGIVQPGIWEGNERHGFDIVDLSTGTSMPLCRTDAPDSGLSAGKFNFYPDAIHLGEKIFSDPAVWKKQIIILDEIGPLELQGKGWSNILSSVLTNYSGVLILTVREHLISDILTAFSFYSDEILSINEITQEVVRTKVLNALQTPTL